MTGVSGLASFRPASMCGLSLPQPETATVIADTAVTTTETASTTGTTSLRFLGPASTCPL